MASRRDYSLDGSTDAFFGITLVVPDAAAAQQMVAHKLEKAFGRAILPI